MKNLTLFIIMVCTIIISCTTNKNALTVKLKSTNSTQLGNIWKNQMQPIDSKRIDTFIKENNLNPSFKYRVITKKDSVFYFTKDTAKMLATIIFRPDSFVNQSNQIFEKRFNETIALYNKIGLQIISKGSSQEGQDWIFVIEYKNETDNNLRFYIDSYINQNFVVSNILTDPAHRSEAINLVNSFTQSVANVTITLQ